MLCFFYCLCSSCVLCVQCCQCLLIARSCFSNVYSCIEIINTKCMYMYFYFMTSTKHDFNNYRKKWDIFQDNFDKEKSDQNENLWKTLEKILTISFAFCLFLIILVGGVTSRISLHILIWHLNPPTINTTIGSQGNVTSGSSYVDENWIWSLFLVIVAPYIFTAVECLRTICLRTTRKMHYNSLFWVSNYICLNRTN